MPNVVSFLLCLSIWLLHLPIISGAPAPSYSELVKRQSDAPVTVVTVNTIQGPSGPLTETCNITLTPITVNGQGAFREEKSCTQSPASSDNGNSPTTSTPQTSDSPASTASSDSLTQQASATTNPSSSTTDSTDLATQSSVATGTLTSALVAPTDVSIIGASIAATTVSAASSGIPSNTEATPLASSVTSAVAAPTDFSVLGASSMDTASANAALATSSFTAGAPNTSATTAAFAIPGKQIQVLPIGLGVFAGVSVIALIVVGLVTYERTKYRKKFRKDKLAESAAPMGYGGMAEIR